MFKVTENQKIILKEFGIRVRGGSPHPYCCPGFEALPGGCTRIRELVNVPSGCPMIGVTENGVCFISREFFNWATSTGLCGAYKDPPKRKRVIKD